MDYNISKISKTEAVLIAISAFVAYGLLKGIWNEGLYRLSPILFWIADALQFVLFPALGVIFLGRVAKIWPRNYGFRPLMPEYSLMEAAVMLVFVTVSCWATYSVVKSIAWSYLYKSASAWGYGTVVPKSQPMKVIVLAYLSLTTAFVEETVFRSLPWLYLNAHSMARKHIGGYVFGTSVLFAMVHWSNGPHNVLATFALGLVSASFYAKIRNIWPLVFEHFLLDFDAFS